MESDRELNLWDVIKNISHSKDPLFVESVYVPFIVTRAFGLYSDTVLLSQEMNERSGLTKQQHFDFLFHAVRKKKRFSSWQKFNEDDRILLIQKVFGYNRGKAVEVNKILTDEQIKKLKSRGFQGGLSKDV